MEKPFKIGLLNAKGGQAKTCTTQNLAHALAGNGYRVLCVDFDPQGSLTFSFGKRPDESEVSISDVLLDGYSIEEAIVATGTEGVDIVPGSLALSSFDITMGNEVDREEQLAKALADVEGYDFILVDPAPTAGLLMLNVLLATDAFILPVTPQYLAVEGLATMLNAVERVRSGFGRCANLLGILLTQVDYRSRATKELVQLIREHYKDQVLETEVRINVKLSEAPSHGKTIFQHDPLSTGAKAYAALSKEVLQRVKHKTKVRSKVKI